MPEQRTLPAKNLAATLTADRAFGRVLSLKECSDVMSRISLEPVMMRLAYFKHINEEVLLNDDEPLKRRISHTRAVLHLLQLRGDRLQQAMRAMEEDRSFRPLSDQAILATMELAIQCCPRRLDHPLDDTHMLELTHVLLSFQSALFSDSFMRKSGTVSSFEALGKEAQEELVRNTLAHTTRIYTRQAMGRFYAFCTAREVKATVKQKTGHSLRDRFKEAFGLTPADYLCCAFLSGGPARRLDPDHPNAWSPVHNEDTFWATLRKPDRSKVEALVSMAMRDVGPPSPVPDQTLTEFLYGARNSHRWPLVKFPGGVLCLSPELTLRKFLFGLPHLLLQATEQKLGRKLKDNEVRQARDVVGWMFEGYIYWLLKRLFRPGSDVKLLRNVTFEVVEKGLKKKKEIDIVILTRGTAIVLELKATVASFAFRMTGKFEELDKMLSKGAEQVHTGARALRIGEARRANGTRINGVRWVIPCVVTYDDIPLFEPISVFYERHLTKLTGRPLFQPEDGVEAVQFFDVDFIESWEDTIDLSPMSQALSGYLIQRARDDSLRYRKVQDGQVKGPTAGAPRPFNEAVEESRAYLDKRARRWLRK